MRPTATELHGLSVRMCVCLSDIAMSCATTDEPIEMPLGVCT